MKKKRDTRPNFQHGLPEGIPRKNLSSVQTWLDRGDEERAPAGPPAAHVTCVLVLIGRGQSPYLGISSAALRFSKMAERNEGEGGCKVGFFYYDWAQSRYRWTDDNRFGHFKVKKAVRASSGVKVGGNRKQSGFGSLRTKSFPLFERFWLSWSAISLSLKSFEIFTGVPQKKSVYSHRFMIVKLINYWIWNNV